MLVWDSCGLACVRTGKGTRADPVAHRMLFRAVLTEALAEFCSALPRLSEVPDPRGAKIAAALAQALLKTTRTLVLVNADYGTAWNERKRLVAGGYQGAQSELRFCDFVFSKHLKSAEAWEHRRWVAKQCFMEAGEMYCDVVVRDELRVCTQVARRYPRNYHAWSHRLWAMGRHQGIEPSPAVVEEELRFSAKWVQENPADHSGWQYRQAVLLMAAQESKWREEMEFLKQVIDALPGHETLWSHARFLFWHMIWEGPGRRRGNPHTKPLAKELLVYAQQAGDCATGASE